LAWFLGYCEKVIVSDLLGTGGTESLGFRLTERRGL
jgi:hypothetical protein